MVGSRNDPAGRSLSRHLGAWPMNRRSILCVIAVISLAVLTMAGQAAANPEKHDRGPLGHFKHLVVIYEENHSFDNLYGLWGSVIGQHVIGLSDADAAHTTQIAQDGAKYTCLKQLDVNL